MVGLLLVGLIPFSYWHHVRSPAHAGLTGTGDWWHDLSLGPARWRIRTARKWRRVLGGREVPASYWLVLAGKTALAVWMATRSVDRHRRLDRRVVGSRRTGLSARHAQDLRDFVTTPRHLRFSSDRADAEAAIASVSDGRGWWQLTPLVEEDIPDMKVNYFGLCSTRAWPSRPTSRRHCEKGCPSRQPWAYCTPEVV